MRRYAVIIIPALGALHLAVACSSSSNTTATATSTGGAASSSSESSSATNMGGDMTPQGSCTHPGDKGNDFGVGEYCTPGGMQCDKFPMAGLCLADVNQDQWFCTKIGCMMDSDCGMDATCLKTMMGSACVPTRCLMGTGGGGGGGGGPADAGSD